MSAVPAAAGPAVPVSTELGYEAFPAAVRDATGRVWAVYSDQCGHVCGTTRAALRWQDPGKTWSVSTTVPVPPPLLSYASMVYGLAAETAAQGGRLWAAVTRYKAVPPASSTDRTGWVMSRACDGTWSSPLPLPAIATGDTFATGVLVRPSGEVLAAAYGTPAGATRAVARLYAYDPVTAAWGARSTITVTVPDPRHVQEPTLLTMADGRLMMLFRSDAAAPYYCYLYSVISADEGATWGTPYRIITHGSGMPTGYVLPTGEIAVAYRGFSQPTNPSAANPPRLTMLDADGTPSYEHLDVLGVTGRYLYGQIVGGLEVDGVVTEPDQWVFAVESPDGQSGSGGAVFSVPLRWAVRS